MERRLCRPSWALAPACAPLASQNKAALGLSGLWHPCQVHWSAALSQPASRQPSLTVPPPLGQGESTTV